MIHLQLLFQMSLVENSDVYDFEPLQVCREHLQSILESVNDVYPEYQELVRLSNALELLMSSVEDDLVEKEDSSEDEQLSEAPAWFSVLPAEIERIESVPMVLKKPMADCHSKYWLHLTEILSLCFQIIKRILKCYVCFSLDRPWAAQGKISLKILAKLVNSWNYRSLLRDEKQVRLCQLQFLDDATALFQALPSFIRALDNGGNGSWKPLLKEPLFHNYAFGVLSECPICFVNRQNIDEYIAIHECRHSCCVDCWQQLERNNT